MLRAAPPSDPPTPMCDSTGPPVGEASRLGVPRVPDAELVQRIRRIYAAIGASEERDLSKLSAKVFDTGRVHGVFQDFSGGMSEEEFANIAHSLIHNIANLKDHLKKWAARNGKDKSKVDQAFKESTALQVIQDLSNNDKHGPPTRDAGRSGVSPRLVEPRRILRMTTKGERGSGVAMTFGPGGVPKVSGSGTAVAVVTGDIVDKDGKSIGDLHATASEAVTRWLEVATELGAIP